MGKGGGYILGCEYRRQPGETGKPQGHDRIHKGIRQVLAGEKKRQFGFAELNKERSLMDLNRRHLLISSAGVAAALAAGTQARSENDAKHAAPGLELLHRYGFFRRLRLCGPDKRRRAFPSSIFGTWSSRRRKSFRHTAMPTSAAVRATNGPCENEAAFNRWVIEPHFLPESKRRISARLVFGSRLSLPVITAPMGGQGLAHAQAHPCVRGTDAAGTLFVDSSVSHVSMEEIAESSHGPKRFRSITRRTRIMPGTAATCESFRSTPP